MFPFLHLFKKAQDTMSKRLTLSIVALIMMVLAGVAVLQITQDNHPQNPTHSSTLPYGPPRLYPSVTDLAPDAVNVESNTVFPSLTYGIHAFFWWDESYRNVGLDHINLMQFTHIRQVFAWADIEPERRATDDPARYVWAQADAMLNDIEAKGIEVVARISKPPDWALRPNVRYGDIPFDTTRLTEYCSAVATRYQGRIAAYQIWNEPNLTREWADAVPSPEGYVKLLAACAAAIRQADPNAIIITAGLSPTGNRDFSAMPDDEFLWQMYAAGLSEHYDILAAHTPGFRYPPEADPSHPSPEGCLQWRCFRRIEHLRAIMVANGDGHKQMAITEMGYTTDRRPDSIYSWFGLSPQTQANYLSKAYQYAAKMYRPWLGLMVALYYPDVAWTQDDEQYWWAIGTVAPLPFGMDGRPAWPALVQMAKISTEPSYDHPARDADLNPIE